MLPKLTLIIGASDCGKSTFAESLVRSSMRPRVYIATAQAFDDEMGRKISRHKKMRGAGWQTVEAPLDAANTLNGLSADSAVLLDCASLWLSNQMLADNDLQQASDHLLAALKTCAAPVVVVSNEVGAGGVADNAMARQFNQAQGRMNQRIAAQADLVVTVIAGLPMLLKGDLPKAMP